MQQNAGTIYGEENQAIFKYVVIYYNTFLNENFSFRDGTPLWSTAERENVIPKL